MKVAEEADHDEDQNKDRNPYQSSKDWSVQTFAKPVDVRSEREHASDHQNN